MKKTVILLLFVSVSFSIFSQEEKLSVEKSIYGIQTGLIGIWVYNETKLANEFALRTEIGLDGGYSYGSNDVPKSQYILLPSLSLEPRWYYNFEQRLEKGKSIANNSANYLSLRTTYNPDWFAITNIENGDFSTIFRVMPSWGIRRDLGANFDFDLRLGFGYVFLSDKNNNIASGWIPDLSVRFGYTF